MSWMTFYKPNSSIVNKQPYSTKSGGVAVHTSSIFSMNWKNSEKVMTVRLFAGLLMIVETERQSFFVFVEFAATVDWLSKLCSYVTKPMCDIQFEVFISTCSSIDGKWLFINTVNWPASWMFWFFAVQYLLGLYRIAILWVRKKESSLRCIMTK